MKQALTIMSVIIIDGIPDMEKFYSFLNLAVFRGNALNKLIRLLEASDKS
jgi:hypothetical protein